MLLMREVGKGQSAVNRTDLNNRVANLSLARFTVYDYGDLDCAGH